MAADYVEQIRVVQPQGPYHLLGWSFGGLVAHEMAVRLRAEGQDVASLVVLDAAPLAEHHDLPPDPGEAEADELDVGLLSDDQTSAVLKVSRNNDTIARQHRAGVFDGDMLLVCPESADVTVADRWRPHARGTIRELRVPHGHQELYHADAMRLVWEAMVATTTTAQRGQGEQPPTGGEDAC
jgi:thioesterase domain-containing protein